MTVLLYTDGSCAATDRVGGWGFIALPSDDSQFSGSGYEYDTTISRMELKGAIMGLAEIGAVYGATEVYVSSDSQYVVKGITDRTRARRANVDLWDLLDNVVDSHVRVHFDHVRGHTGVEGNEIADDLAGNARKAALGKLNGSGTSTRT